MNILVTGAAGFVGKNLCAALKNLKDGKDKTRPTLSIEEIFEYDIDSNPADLEMYCKQGFVFERCGFGAWCGFTVDKRQMDRAVGVGVSDRRADARIHDLKRDLLAAFAGKRLTRRFARLDLSADELPVSSETTLATNNIDCLVSIRDNICEILKIE